MLGNILVGRYQIVSYLGGGGFGETYVASDTHLPGAPQCVVKKLKPQATDPVTLQTARRLFATEAQVLYELGTHDRIPQLLAYFEENEEFYLVQEFIESHDLSQELTPQQPWEQERVVSTAKEILEILQFVHQRKVIHRDVNPQNLLRRKQDDKLVLIDFGAVKQITTQMITPGSQSKFTVAIGTPGYIPCEQAQGDPKFSSDIYAVGIICIQALTGLSPDQLEKDADTNEIIWQKYTTVSEDFANILDKMVRYDFRQRYPSATVAMLALKDLSNPTFRQTTPLNLPISTNHLKKIAIPKKLLIKCLVGGVVLGIGGTTCLHLLNSANAQELYKQANTLYELQRYKDALDVYEQAVNIRPDYAQAWNGEANTLAELKKYQEALAAYDKAIQIQPDYLEAWSGRGFILNKLQRYTEAIASFDKVLQVEKNHSNLWNAQGEAFSNLNQSDRAIKSYEKAIELKPDYYEAWYNKARVLHNLKRYEEAISAYSKTVELKPDYSLAWYNQGNAMVNLNRYQDAFNAYDKAVQYKQEYYQAWLSRGNTLLNLQRYAEAVESFNQAIKSNPNNYQAWYGRGWAQHQIQHDEEAVNSYNKAIELKRNDYQIWYNRGNSLFNLKKYGEAIASYNRAVRYKPEHYESWYSRGNALLNLKQYPEAIASYEKAIKLKPDYQKAIDARNQAQNLLGSQQIKV